MKRIRTSALVAAVMIGSAAFAASVSADSSGSSDRHAPRMSASGSYEAPSGTGLAGDWQGDLRMNITSGSGSDYAGSFRIPATDEGTVERTGSLVAVDNGDGTYSVTFTDMATGTSQTSLFTLADGELTGSVSFDNGTKEIRASRKIGPRADRGRDSGSGAAVHERPANGSGSGSETISMESESPTKPALSEKIRIKLDAKFDAIDESKREEFYRDLLDKLDILLSKDSKRSQKELLEGVRDHVQSRLDSEFGEEPQEDDMLDELFGQ